MKVELRELMNDNEMLSHIFLGCIPENKLVAIRDKFVGDKDWQKESAKIPVEMKIGGVAVNPKEFFSQWKEQMQDLILEKSKELVAEKMGSKRMSELMGKLYDFEQVLESWENEINWDVENPFLINVTEKTEQETCDDCGYEINPAGICINMNCSTNEYP